MSRRSSPRHLRPTVVRGPALDRRTRLGNSLADLWERALEAYPLWVALYLVIGTWCLLPSGTFVSSRVEAGSIAVRDYEARRDLLVPDPETTESKRARARDDVLPVYDFDSALAAQRDRQFGELFAAGRALQEAPARPRGAEPAPEPSPSEALAQASGLRLTPAVVTLLRARQFPPALEERLRSLVLDVLARGTVADKTSLLENRVRGITLRNLETGSETTQLDLYDYLSYPNEVREQVRKELRGLAGYGAQDRARLEDLVVDNLTSNLLPNRSETLARRDRAAAATPPVFTQVRKGQIVVRKGDEITASAAQIINAMIGRSTTRGRLLPVLGSFLLLTLMALVAWLGRLADPVPGKSGRRTFGELLLVLTAVTASVRLGILLATATSGFFETAPFNSLSSYLYALPVAALALVAQLLYGRLTALQLTVVFAVLVGRLATPEGLSMAIYTIAGSLAGIHALDRSQFKQRSVMTRAGLKIGLLNVVVILMLASLTPEAGDGLAQLGFDMLCGALGGVLCAAVASFAIPVFESLLSITTDIKLVELSNTNLPLLRRLALEAPGTFQHSVMVANLAKSGCEAIGADSILAYTVSLYHDVGKLPRPEYFIENQRTGINPHDKLSPSMSTLVLVNHIKDGVELARQHRLPRPIRDAIEQHHGTRRITYFYNRAVERSTPSEEVSEEKYRYPGPKPQDRVMGVLMLADGVEAASRTLNEPSPTRIRSLIKKIVDDCLANGQLDETDLTLSDIRRVSDAFLGLLSNLYHRRIDYPGFDFNSQRGSRPEGGQAG